MQYETTLLVAILTSTLLLVLGCSMLFATRAWLALLAEYAEHPHRLLIPGLATVVFGLIIVFNHNIWTGGWAVAVSITGWLVLLKGLTFLFGPRIVGIHTKFPHKLVKMTMRVGGGVVILLALMLLLTFTGRA